MFLLSCLVSAGSSTSLLQAEAHLISPSRNLLQTAKVMWSCRDNERVLRGRCTPCSDPGYTRLPGDDPDAGDTVCLKTCHSVADYDETCQLLLESFAITDLNADELSFPSLVQIEGDLMLDGNHALTNLSLPLLEKVKRSVKLHNLKSLPTFHFPRLTSCGGNFEVVADASGNEFNALDAVKVNSLIRVGGSVVINATGNGGNRAMDNVASVQFRALTWVEGDVVLHMDRNAGNALTVLDCRALSEVNGGVYITGGSDGAVMSKFAEVDFRVLTTVLPPSHPPTVTPGCTRTHTSSRLSTLPCRLKRTWLLRSRAPRCN
jgi:hypothetical protein